MLSPVTFGDSSRSYHRIPLSGIRCGAFTIIELLVALVIIAIIVALTMPALNSARESSRFSSCASNLRQHGLAFELHHGVYKQLPTNGWGWGWTGDSTKGGNKAQPGGWAFNILPFIEMTTLYNSMNSDHGRALAFQTGVGLYNCPSRRPSRLTACSQEVPKPFNCELIKTAFKIDYGVCSGDAILEKYSGPSTSDSRDVSNYAWPSPDTFRGVSFIRSQIRYTDIRDGAANQILVGEKYVGRSFYFNGQSIGDDQGFLVGDDPDIRRTTAEPPRQDAINDNSQCFGSAHNNQCNFVFADGSVRGISYDIDSSVFQLLGSRADGKLPDVRD